MRVGFIATVVTIIYPAQVPVTVKKVDTAGEDDGISASQDTKISIGIVPTFSKLTMANLLFTNERI